MRTFLMGKKTYLLAAAGGLTTVAWLLNLIDRETYEALMAFLGFGTVAALRAGVTREGTGGNA